MPAEGALRDGPDPDFQLIETMRRAADGSLVRLDRHMDRLKHSAHELGFEFDRQAIDAQLTALPPANLAQRLRLTLARDGNCRMEVYPFHPLPASTVWRLRIATIQLNSDNLLLRHKTTLREVYEDARAQYAREDADEVLLLNEAGHICEGSITSVFAMMSDGTLITPPLECGLLAGVLRAELLERGEAMEGLLRPQDLRVARELYIGNSLRGLIRAKLEVD